MTIIKDQYFEGERPLYESRDLQLSRVTIGEGESGLKESRSIEAVDCENLILEDCVLDESCDRAFEKSSYSKIPNP